MTNPAGTFGEVTGALAERRTRWGEGLIEKVLFLSALVCVLTTAAIIWVLVSETYGFFQTVSPIEFFFGTQWTPMFQPQHFGVLPLICGTLLVTLGSALIALPLGVGSALYLSEYASHRVRSTLKPILEVLAGIPTVVYGYFAVTAVTPFLRKVYPGTEVFNAASAAIVVGIMILPMVASLCDDAFRAVPNTLRAAGYAVGATKYEVSTKVVFPSALSGVLASFVLALSRAIGETMAVALAAGATPKITFNPFESIQTMTAYIVQVANGDVVHGTVEYKTIFAVGALLFFITLALNLTAYRVLRRYREVYE